LVAFEVKVAEDCVRLVLEIVSILVGIKLRYSQAHDTSYIRESVR